MKKRRFCEFWMRQSLKVHTLCNKKFDISGTTCSLEKLNKEDRWSSKHKKLVVERGRRGGTVLETLVVR